MTRRSWPIAAANAPRPAPLLAWLAYFLRLGLTGFGGPIALAGHMQRDLVDRRRWLSTADYLEGLAFAQLSPGPLAAQLAMYLGWLRAGALGAVAAGVAFVAPSFLMVVGLAALYVRYGGLPWLHGAFYGIGAAVVAIIARSAVKLVRSALKRSTLLWALFAISALVTIATESEILWLFVASGFAAVAVEALPRWRGPAIAPGWLAGPSLLVPAAHGTTLGMLSLFFVKASVVVFGSGLAIVPFLYGGVVADHHWLTDRQFLDAVAVAMITPGPVVITAGFIGYLVAGPAGAGAAALGVFGPPCAIVIVAAPAFRRLANQPLVAAFVRGVTAAAVGAIAGAAVILARRALVDVTTVAMALATLLLILRKVPDPVAIVLAGAAGILLAPAAALLH